ncbi:MAG: hypothetical protein ACFFB3_01170 [Candidatus Hodarchaeota archaeon]
MQSKSEKNMDIEATLGTYSFKTDESGELLSISYVSKSGYEKTIQFAGDTTEVKMALISLLEKELCGISRDGC